MVFQDPASGLTIDGDFERGNADSIRQEGPAAYSLRPRPERLPALAHDQGVPTEYFFAARFRVPEVRGAEPQRVLVCVRTGPRGINYLQGPYWLRHNGHWSPVTAVAHDRAGLRADVEVLLPPGESVLSNQAFLTPTEVERHAHELADVFPFLTVSELGRTAEGRPILALESEPRPHKVVVAPTQQPAEPAEAAILHIAHWLGSRSSRVEQLRERWQFCLIPSGNPDGAAHGNSVLNGVGEAPMAGYTAAVAGQPGPLETAALWRYYQEIQPLAFIEAHCHQQDNIPHKVNWPDPSCYEGKVHPMVVAAVHGHLATLNDDWRTAPLPGDHPLWGMRTTNVLAREFGAFACVAQIYARTAAAISSQLVATVARWLEGIDSTSRLQVRRG
jgi:hypothetical protein